MNDHTFFENFDCKYHPCHQGLTHINCLHCFCPWFGNCGMMMVEGKKCEDCTFPHDIKNRAVLMKGIKSIQEIYNKDKNATP
jgi:Zn-finger protein